MSIWGAFKERNCVIKTKIQKIISCWGYASHFQIRNKILRKKNGIETSTGFFQVLICVVLTLVNVAGFMHFWGLTVDTVSCTNLIIAIGRNQLFITYHFYMREYLYK